MRLPREYDAGVLPIRIGSFDGVITNAGAALDDFDDLDIISVLDTVREYNVVPATTFSASP